MRGTTKTGVLALSLILAMPIGALAEDVRRSDADDAGARASLLEDGGYFEIGVLAYANRSIRARANVDGPRDTDTGGGVNLAGAWRRGRLFVEAQQGDIAGASLGATLWHDERRVVDLLAAHLPGTVTASYSSSSGDGDVDPADLTERERNTDLIGRNSVFGMSGLRYREYRGDALFQFSATASWRPADGAMLAAHAGRQWQFGNWNAQGLAGVRYATSDLIDFLYGVDADEATARFPEYEAPDGWLAEGSVQLTRPLTRDWVFRTGLRVRGFDDAFTDSPMVARSVAASGELGISYVF